MTLGDQRDVARDDRLRVADADHVLHGPGGAGLVRRVLYALYVTAFLAVLYAYAIVRAVLVTSDTRWLRAHVGGWSGVALGLGAFATLLAVAWLVGRRRGPATPPLPWVDQVVTSSLGRRVALRPWWRAAALGVAGCAAILGAVVGAAISAAGLASWVAIPVGFALGGGAAAAAVWVGLRGQSAESHRGGDPTSVTPSALLASLGIDELRRHARSSQRLHGAALAGDPRAARLEVASTIRRGRSLRLAPGRLVPTTCRRDLIGLRRQPGLALAGALAAITGFGISTMTLIDTTTPVPVTALGVALVHLAAGLWSQGLRTMADGVSSPALFGGSLVRRALAHSVVPAAAFVVVGVSVGAFCCLVTETPRGILWLALSMPFAVLPVCIGAQWWSAFRVSHPDAAFVPEFGPILLVLGVARPWLVVLGSATTTLQRLHTLPSAGIGLGLLAFTGLLVLWRGRSLARKLVDEGR